MEERKLNFNAPLLSVRRLSTKPQSSVETKNKNVIFQSSNRSKNLSVPVHKQNISFDHLTEPASVPFVWEKIPGRPKEDNVISGNESAGSDLGCRNDVYPDAFETFSVNWSISGVSGFEGCGSKKSEKSSMDTQFREFMMSRFLPAAKAMTLEQQPRISQKKPPRQSQEAVITVRKPLGNVRPLYPDDDDDDDDDGYDDDVSSNIAKKGLGFLPRICVKNSVGILNAVPVSKDTARRSLMKTNNSRKPGKTFNRKFTGKTVDKRKPGFEVRSLTLCRSNRFVNDSGEQLLPSWSTRHLSGLVSPYRYASNREIGYVGTPEKPEIFRSNELKRFLKGISRSQEFYPRRTRENSTTNSPISGKTLHVDTVNFLNRVNSTRRTPSRFGRIEKNGSWEHSYDIQDAKFLNTSRGKSSNDSKPGRERKSLEPVKKAAEKCDMKEEIICGGSETPSPIPPPLPKTPSESWLSRTLPSMPPRNSIANPYGNSRFNPDKPKNPKAVSEYAKWETIVKTSFSHNDHVRYSEELTAHPSSLSET